MIILEMWCDWGPPSTEREPQSEGIDDSGIELDGDENTPELTDGLWESYENEE